MIIGYVLLPPIEGGVLMMKSQIYWFGPIRFDPRLRLYMFTKTLEHDSMNLTGELYRMMTGKLRSKRLQLHQLSTIAQRRREGTREAW